MPEAGQGIQIRCPNCCTTHTATQPGCKEAYQGACPPVARQAAGHVQRLHPLLLACVALSKLVDECHVLYWLGQSLEQCLPAPQVLGAEVCVELGAVVCRDRPGHRGSAHMFLSATHPDSHSVLRCAYKPVLSDCSRWGRPAAPGQQAVQRTPSCTYVDARCIQPEPLTTYVVHAARMRPGTLDQVPASVP